MLGFPFINRTGFAIFSISALYFSISCGVIISFELYELILGFLFSLLALVMFSKVGSPPTPDMRHELKMAKRE
ncbi:hypothetical protein [Salinicoccus luteus]|uniref:hypothetical protein n=1 Tax=Salinicoccus luteus TaxID=367840 RepID=UPI000A83C605|nr:hypothetical protein [Salinicoccus luteus]